MKKRNVFLLILVFFIFKIIAYESGWEESLQEIRFSCLELLENDILRFKEKWQDTHCKSTAFKIIELFEQKKIIEKIDNIKEDFDDFIKNKVGQKLFVNSGKRDHLLFFLNLCGGSHVLVIEKKETEDGACWYRIFQSWQNQFTLSAWLGIDQFQSQNNILQEDFGNLGQGQRVLADKIFAFLKCLVNSSQDRLQKFIDFGLAMPFEIDAVMYRIL
jgi:hypothetical protein